MLIDRLKGLFRGDAVLPSAAVFPDIDEGAVARELKLREKGREAGARDLPRPEETSLDATEMAAVARIEALRRKGLENYEGNKDVYARRLSRATTASLEVRSVAGAALGDFELEVKAFRGRMTSYVKDLREWSAALTEFRRRHRLYRPAYKAGNWPAALVVLLLGVIVETVLNGYLFAQRNELGLLGGALVALLVSVVNVTVSALCGLYAQLARHRNPLARLGGLAVIAGWLGFAGGFNLAVAHFRDAVETLAGWGAAAQASLDRLLAEPFQLVSIESWLLMLVGVLVGVLAFLKLLHFGEPYPGYSRISSRFDQALDDYADQLVEALESLEAKRDEAIQGLQEAHEVVRENVGDAIDALYGHRMMRAHLQAFLDSCDLKAQALLRTYRDENRAARRAPAPARFDEPFRFPPFHDPEVDLTHREDASRELREINRIVDEAIAAIHADYRRLKHDYPDPHSLIGLEMPGEALGAPPERTLSDRVPSAAAPAGAPAMPPAAVPAPTPLGVVEGSRRG